MISVEHGDDGSVTVKPLNQMEAFGQMLDGAVVPHTTLMTNSIGITPGVHFTTSTVPLTTAQTALLPTVNHIVSVHPSPTWAVHLGTNSVFVDGHLVDTSMPIHPAALVNPPTLLDGGLYHSVTMSSLSPSCPNPNLYKNMHYSVSTKPMTYSPPCPGLPMHQFILKGHVEQNIGSTVSGLGCMLPVNDSSHRINLTVAEGNACGVDKVTMHSTTTPAKLRRRHYHHSWAFLHGLHPGSASWLSANRRPRYHTYHHYYGGNIENATDHNVDHFKSN
jgi:hypothetical protein